jgi:hypothetical protein
MKWREEDKSKVPLVVFGNGMFGKNLVKLKGLRCGVAGVLWRCLKKREAAGDLIVLPVDEYKTSRICSRCETDSLGDVACIKGHSVLLCKKCNTLWQRDINAAKNMMAISLSVWKGNGRPKPFSRK